MRRARSAGVLRRVAAVCAPGLGLLAAACATPAGSWLRNPFAPESVPAPLLGHAPHYGRTAWSTLHRDARNSDASPLVAPARARVVWRALEGAALFVGPTLGPEGHVYASSGRGKGTSHLHAFDRDGRLLWASAPMESLADLDQGAVINAPLVGEDGSVYQGDLDQLWCFSADGEVRWVASLYDEDAQGHYVTPIFTREGHVGGFTTDGRGLFFDAQTGEPVWPAFTLPGVAGPPSQSVPAGLLGGGLVAPAFIQPVWDIIYGRGIEVANTPAVHPETGRIFITAGGATASAGTLYGIDTGPQGLSIAFATPMAAGSGTSPALSADGHLVYAAGEDGVMIAVDADSGDIAWRAEGVQAAASPAVGPDGAVYSFDGPKLVSLDGTSGALRWKASYESLARAWLPPSEQRGPRAANINGIVSLSARYVHVALDLGYTMAFAEGPAFVQPHRFALVAIDPADGHLVAASELPGSSSALIVPNADGRIYVSLVDAATSMQFYGVNRLLPEGLRAPGPPRAGLVAFAPLSSRDYLREAIDWARERAALAWEHVRSGAPAAAIERIDEARAQIAGLAPAIAEAQSEGALAAERAQALRAELALVRKQLESAREAAPEDAARARHRLARARAELLSVAAMLVDR